VPIRDSTVKRDLSIVRDTGWIPEKMTKATSKRFLTYSKAGYVEASGRGDTISRVYLTAKGRKALADAGGKGSRKVVKRKPARKSTGGRGFGGGWLSLW